jgi:hypothetical protein
MLAEEVEERKRKINCKILLSLEWKKQHTALPSYMKQWRRFAYFPLPQLATSQRIHSMATIRMAALSSQGTYFMSLGLAAYPMRSKTLEKQPP